MRHNRLTNLRRIFAGLSVLSLTILAIPMSAPGAPESPAELGFRPAYAAARESTLVGTIQELVTEDATGSPAGMHLLVTGLKGVGDVQVGPFVRQMRRQALEAGAPVLFVGVGEQQQTDATVKTEQDGVR
jgi:hypothetical protein